MDTCHTLSWYVRNIRPGDLGLAHPCNVTQLSAAFLSLGRQKYACSSNVLFEYQFEYMSDM